MAQGDSFTSICNAAMIHLGEDLIVSVFPPDNSKRAILCNERFHAVRRRVLRAHPWTCAKRQASLAASVTAPLFDYGNAYPLPADFLRMWDESEDDNDQPDYELQSGVVLTDDGPPFNIVYLFDLQDPTVMDALLVDLIGLELALELCEPLDQSAATMNGIESKLKRIEGKAELVDSQENTSKELDDDVWLRARA
jgi:hypothetical protein